MSCRPAISDWRRVSYFRADEATQTDESDIVELKNVTGTIGTLKQVLHTTLALFVVKPAYNHHTVNLSGPAGSVYQDSSAIIIVLHC